MGYTKTTWVDGTTPAINATNLNNIEDGIARVSVSSTTDNTLPRFHSTNGTLQTSGVVVDDNNNVSGIGTDLTLTATPGSYGGISYGGGISRRWYVGKNNATESGSAAGSQFIIWAYDDSGSQTHKPFTIYRENGKVALSVTGGSAGVEISVGGPREMVGTGSPESSVTAPAGSVWRQTDDATFSYLKWYKATGTGNTG